MVKCPTYEGRVISNIADATDYFPGMKYSSHLHSFIAIILCK